MMNKKLFLLFLINIFTYLSFSQIAITEFMNNPVTPDAENEWIELYNYTDIPVNIKNWSIHDEDLDSTNIVSSDLIIQPNDYLILAVNKDSMEANWFGGVANSKVIEYNNFFLANGEDEIILKDSNSNIIWSLAYLDDEVNGIATFLAYNHDFSSGVTVWGNKPAPGISRDGIDVASSTIGYQGDSATSDVNEVSSLKGDVKGSPLAGSYISINTSNIISLNRDLSFLAYPNPVHNQLKLSKKLTGSLFSVNGKKVKTFIKTNTINVSNLPAGIYFLKANDVTKKIIKK